MCRAGPTKTYDIFQETTLASGCDSTVIPEKLVTEQEQELLAKFKPVLQAFLHDHIQLQVTAVYALQVFTYTHKFPKGSYLRKCTGIIEWVRQEFTF